MAMYQLILLLGILFAENHLAYDQVVVPPITITPSCKDHLEVKKIVQQLKSSINNILGEIAMHFIPECGDGLWYRVAYLNMSDASQQCPPAWREYNSSRVRACGRPVFNDGSRPSTFYITNRQYSRVCGRVIGFQVGNPDAFFQFNAVSLDQSYMDGISITHGEPRQHIWSYVASHSENSADHPVGNCPCSVQQGTTPPSFIGNNYYCESANFDMLATPQDLFYTNDRLWDGRQCEGNCCTGAKSPPWFSVQLSNHTTDRIEVRICGDEFTANEDSPIELLEIYVQ